MKQGASKKCWEKINAKHDGRIQFSKGKRRYLVMFVAGDDFSFIWKFNLFYHYPNVKAHQLAKTDNTDKIQ